MPRSRIVIIYAIIGVLAIALGAIVTARLTKSTVGSRAYYYDLSEKRRFVDSAALHPPLAGIGGEPDDGVVAVVYAPGKDSRDRRIAYLQTFTPELSRLMREADEAVARGEDPPPQIQDRVYLTRNTLVRRLDGDEWFPRDSPEGREICAVLLRPCENGQMPWVCGPDD